jgi:hypothetical protein
VTRTNLIFVEMAALWRRRRRRRRRNVPHCSRW